MDATWAALRGYANSVQWPAGDGFREEPPLAGEECELVVYDAFKQAPGEPFWTLFMPAPAEWNGWDAGPRGLEALLLVRCELLRAPEPLPHEEFRFDRRRTAARVLEAHPVREWALQQPLTHGGQVHGPWGGADHFERGDLILLVTTLEGDAGQNLLYLRTEPRWTLVLHHSWSFDDHDELFAGRRQLTAEEQAECAKALQAK